MSFDPADGAGEHDLAPPREPGPAEPTTVRALVGRNVSRLRRDAEATHGDIARAARHHGLDWSEAWIVGIERGQKAIAADHLLTLPFVLATALAHRVSLADLLIGDDTVTLAPGGIAVNAAQLRDVVTASALRRSFGTPSGAIPETAESIEAARTARRAERLRDIRRAGLGDVDIRVLADTEVGAGDVEDRAARRLAVPQSVIVAASAILWGRSMTHEMAAQVAAIAPEASATARTRHATAVNRLLNAQLAEQIASAAARAAESEMRVSAEAVDEPDAVEALGADRH